MAPPEKTTPVLILRILANLDAFRAGKLSVLDLAQDLSNTASALNGSIPLDVRDEIDAGAGDLELEALSSDSTASALVVVDRIDAVVRSYFRI
jgi:hypothetical protein